MKMTSLLLLVLFLGCCNRLAEATELKKELQQKSEEASALEWSVVPLNTAVVAGQQVSLICISATANTLTWYFQQIDAPIHDIVVDDCTMNPAYADRYAMANIAQGRCDLVVLNATVAQAGMYGCQAAFDLAVTAQLVVLDSEPECSSDIVEPVLVAEKVTFSCQVSYTSNISPMLMSWTDAQGLPVTSYTNNSLTGRTTSSIAVVTNWPTLTSYSCRTYFSAPNNLTTTATNTPNFSHTYSSPTYNIITPGVGYVRWGRTVCATGSEVVYKGYIAGGHYLETGSGGNFLCTHENPQNGTGNVAGVQSSAARLHGTELQFNAPYGNNQPFSNENLGGGNVYGQDVLCAVCYRPKRSYSLMIPGRHDCGEGNSAWALEYKGYLAASWSGPSYQRTEYICVDEAPEGRPGGQGTSSQSILYPVQPVCGSLPCPAYVAGNEVTCAVCSR